MLLGKKQKTDNLMPQSYRISFLVHNKKARRRNFATEVGLGFLSPSIGAISNIESVFQYFNISIFHILL